MLTGILYDTSNECINHNRDSVSIVQYLRFDTNKKKIGVVYDLSIRNHRSYDGLLWMVLRGDVKLSMVPDEVILTGLLSENSSKVDICTAFLKEFSDVLIGERPKLDENLCFTDWYKKRVCIEHQKFHNTFKRINDGNGPFSLYEIQVPANTDGWLRLDAVLEGDTYSLMKGKNFLCDGTTYYDYKHGFVVHGGENLVSLIRKDLVAQSGESLSAISSSHLFSRFTDKFYTPPRYYNVVILTEEGEPLVNAEEYGCYMSSMGSSPFPFKNYQVNWFYMLYTNYTEPNPGFEIEVREALRSISQLNQSNTKDSLLVRKGNPRSNVWVPLSNDQSDIIEFTMRGGRDFPQEHIRSAVNRNKQFARETFLKFYRHVKKS